MMAPTEFIRKAFTVRAEEVTFDNVHEVAAWCKGTVEMELTKILGTETKLPVIKLKGQGDNRGKEFTATLGCYVVELKGSFRVYKQTQFFQSFEQKVVLEEDGQPYEPEIDDEYQEEDDIEVEPFVAQSFVPVSPEPTKLS
jgi:hypothetical protein